MRYAAPSAEHWFGTDALGRDVFSRVVYGARISLEVGIIVVVVSSIIGTFLSARLPDFTAAGSINFCRVIFSTFFSRFPVLLWRLLWSRFWARVWEN
jgi:ABC-type dipeptide/oligopeptide/nickel transport system permease subunit